MARRLLNRPATPNPDLDLLFVIDDSPSMTDKQVALKAAFPELVAQLANAPGGLPNLHLGVVTSDMGTSAKTGTPAPALPGCKDTGKGPELVLHEGALANLIERFLHHALRAIIWKKVDQPAAQHLVHRVAEHLGSCGIDEVHPSFGICRTDRFCDGIDDAAVAL